MDDRLDLSLKPSLCTYTFRPQQEPPQTQLHEVEDEGALLAMVESQAAVAISKMKSNEPRMAVSILRRAYDMVETSAKEYADIVPPSKLLAAASVRLAMCVVLSSIGKHAQALTEARASALEMDKVWRSLFLASAEQVIATQDGDVTKPAAPLRAALRSTPSWLQRAVEVAIQARQCIALELEFLEGAGGLQPMSAQSSMTRNADELAARPGGDGASSEAGSTKEADPESLPLQKQQEMLHKEGVELARQLLPAEHPVRVRAELAFEQWQERISDVSCSSSFGSRSLRRSPHGKHVLTKVLAQSHSAPLPLSSHPSSAAQPAAPSETAWQWSDSSSPASAGAEFPWILHKHRHKRLPARSGHDGSQSGDSPEDLHSPASGSHDGLHSDGSFSEMARTDGLQSPAPPSYAHAAPGDVYTSSIKGRRRLPQLQGAASAPALALGSDASLNEAGTTQGGQSANPSTQQSPPSAQHLKDPFEDWRRNMLNPNQMSYFLRQLKTDHGLVQLQGDLKQQGSRFKNFELKELDKDRLFQNRTLFCSAGLAATQRAEKRMDEWKKRNWEVTGTGEKRMKGTDPELFSYYGVDYPKSRQPDMSSLNKLLKASQTHGVNLDREMQKELKAQKAKQREEMLKEREKRRRGY